MSTAAQPPQTGGANPEATLPLAALTRLAWRNIWRQRRRTLLLIAVVAYASLATIFIWGFDEGFNQSLLDNQARLLAAPMLVSTVQHHSDPNPENALPETLALEPLLTDIRAIAGVNAAAPRLETPALLRSPYLSTGGRLRGIDPALEPQVSQVPANVQQGRMLERSGEVVLGQGLAERLDVRVGERLAVDVSALAGPQGLGLQVVGLIDSGVEGVDQRMVLVHIDDARLLSGVTTATAIAIAAPFAQEEQILSRLQPRLPEGVQAYGLLEIMGPAATRIRVSRYVMTPIVLLFCLFAALAVTSTLLVSVLERNKEFGAIVAIGLEPRKLGAMVLVEALFTTVLGWLLGLLLGYALVVFMANYNILGPAFRAASEGIADIGLGREIYTNVSARYALYAAATIVIAAVLAMLIPARRVLRIDPIEAMRSE